MINWIKNLFKSKPKEPPFNIHHPDVAQNIEFAFEVKGRKYYRFAKDYQIPVGRFKFADAYIYEAELRMDLKKLNSYMDELEKHLDGSKGVISITKATQVIWAIRSRCQLAFSPETIERLASAVYFDETENLSELDEAYAAEKVKFWKTSKSYAFFLTKPISDLLNLNGFSEESLPTYINQIVAAELLIKDLTLDHGNPSLENT